MLPAPPSRPHRRPARRRAARLAAWSCLALLAGCGNVESDIRKAFVDRYERENCLAVATGFPFQVRVGTGFFANRDTDWLDALVEGGMLRIVQRPDGRNPLGAPQAAVVLDLTPEGRKRLKDNKLCYGRTAVVKVVDYQGPNKTREGEFLEAEVLLQHHVDGDWVLNPKLGDRVRTGEEKVTRTLVRKAKAGWVLP